jgi:hypothetical protein
MSRQNKSADRNLTLLLRLEKVVCDIKRIVQSAMETARWRAGAVSRIEGMRKHE